MKMKQFDDSGFVMRLEPGDDILETIKDFYTEKGFKFGFIWGIGSVENPVLAHYKIGDKKYSEQPMVGIFEVASLHGNVSVLEGEVLPHVHAVVSDEQMKAYGGHFVAGKVSATMELLLRGSVHELKKIHSEQIGLNIWDF